MDKANILKNNPEIADKIDGYNFFQLVRILENLIDTERGIGDSFHPGFDLVKFNQLPNLSFRQSHIRNLNYDTTKGNLNVIVNFFGLLGVNSPMPYFFTEHVLDMIREKEYSLIDFLNIFHHRAISLFYRAWKLNQQVVSYELNNDDHYCKYLYSMIGQNYKFMRKTSDLPLDAKLFYSGHMMMMNKSAESLKSILKGFFKIPVKIKEFVSHWLNIPEEFRMIIGKKNYEVKLGNNTFAGEKVFSQTAKYKIIMGPMKLDKYNKLLPGSVWYKCLLEWIKLCAPPELICEVQLILRKDEVPFMSSGIRLGYSSWAYSSTPQEDQSNFVFTVY